MLILSRRVGERIRIGDAIELVVQRVCGERVTLGLVAPRDVKILRGELEKFEETPPISVPVEAAVHVEPARSISRARVPRLVAQRPLPR
jgi:carbon storage regulator